MSVSAATVERIEGRKRKEKTCEQANMQTNTQARRKKKEKKREKGLNLRRREQQARQTNFVNTSVCMTF